jgi:2-methylfumaryl-CoA isomerase
MYDLLSGMRIVEGSAFVAAPIGGMTLAQMGADVIRYDDIGGPLDGRRWPITAEGKSLYWANLNKGKRSLAVDLRAPEGQEIVAALMTAPGANAGMVVTNLPSRPWRSFETLRERRPDMIMVEVLGQRDGSPAVDYTVNAMTGFPFITGDSDDGAPVNSVIPAWDLFAGMNLVAGLLAAERKRRDTGEGRHIRVALLDAALTAVSALGYYAEVAINGTDRPKLGNHLFGTYGRGFRCADGKWVYLAMLTPRQVGAMRDLIGADAFDTLAASHKADLNLEADRYRLRDEIDALVEPWVAARPLAEVEAALRAGGVLFAPYRTVREALEDDPALVRENPLFEEVDQPGIGRFPAAGLPLWFDGMERGPVARAPKWGEHTDEILTGVLDMSDGEIGKLHDKGVVAGPSN